MRSSSLTHLYFESVSPSKSPVIWIACAVLLHVGLFCLPVRHSKPSRQEIVFSQGDAGIQVELLPQESAIPANDQAIVSPEVSPVTEVALVEPVSKPEDTPPSRKSAASTSTSARPPGTKSKRATEQTLAGSPRAGTAAAQPASQIFTTQPPYPPEARELGVEGAVRLQVRVGVDGCPRAVKIVHSSGRSDFDLASLTTVQRQWRFRPARTADGAAVESTILVAIQFILKS
jgi:protein TonB